MYYMVNFFYLDKNPKKCAIYYCDKHVNKIFIEICQLLCNVIHNNTNLIPPYKKCKNISLNLAPYLWASKSISNYMYLINLAEALLKEYKFRYQKDNHKSEKVLIWLKNNIPNFFKFKNRTKLIYTKNINIFKNHFKNDVTCSRYIYVTYKCKNDKWTKRDKPEWFNILLDKSNKKKIVYKKKLLNNVKNKLPEKYKNNKKIKVKRFHSFLRIIYDNLFQEKWINYIKKYKNMYNPKKPLIDQLSFIHLKEAIIISNKLLQEKELIKLNNFSLKKR